MDNIITIKQDDECSIFGKPYACVNPKEVLLIYFYNDIVDLILEYFFDKQLKHIIQLLSDFVFMTSGCSIDYDIHISWTIKNNQPIIRSVCNTPLFNGQMIYVSIIFRNNIENIIVKQNNIEVTDEKIKYELFIEYLNEIIIKEKTGNNDIKLICYGYNYLQHYHHIPTIIRNVLDKIINVLAKTNENEQVTFKWIVIKINENDMRFVPNVIMGKYDDMTFVINNYLGVRVEISNIIYKFAYSRPYNNNDIVSKTHNFTSYNGINRNMSEDDINTVYDFLSGWIKQFE